VKFEPIVSLLESAGLGTAGRDIFINFIPENVSGILLREDFGGTKPDHYLPGYIQTTFWLIARGTEFVTVKTQIEAAVLGLWEASRYGVTVDSTTFKYIRPRVNPFPYAPSPGQNIEFGSKMECCYVDVTGVPV
jgi:hypothetical protein